MISPLHPYEPLFDPGEANCISFDLFSPAGEEFDLSDCPFELPEGREFARRSVAVGDGAVTTGDITTLRRYFANFDYDTGTSTVILRTHS